LIAQLFDFAASAGEFGRNFGEFAQENFLSSDSLASKSSAFAGAR
jgi:hypothetical protein